MNVDTNGNAMHLRLITDDVAADEEARQSFLNHAEQMQPAHARYGDMQQVATSYSALRIHRKVADMLLSLLVF